MRQGLTALLAAFLLLLLVGCAQEETATVGQAFVGGTEGLRISFLQGLPPSEVFDTDNPFQIGVEIENRGEYSIENAQDIKVSISGVNPVDFGVGASDFASTAPEPLQGVRLDGAGNVINGDIATVEFPDGKELQYAKTVKGSVSLPLRANVCYEYGTQAQGKLCVRKDLRGVAGETGVCNPDREVPAENSGAPIQITNIRQNVAGSDRIDFFFTIQKMTAVSDSLYKPGSACDSALANRDVVFVDVSDTGLGELRCTGLKDGDATSGYTTLRSGSIDIRCSQTVDNLDDFEQVIDISLTYAYKEFVDTTLVVKQSE